MKGYTTLINLVNFVNIQILLGKRLLFTLLKKIDGRKNELYNHGKRHKYISGS